MCRIEARRRLLAQQQLQRGLWRNLTTAARPQGIGVSSIRVGPTASEPTPATDADVGSITEEWVARGGPPPETPAPVESVAEAVLFIVSRARSWRIPAIVVDPA